MIVATSQMRLIALAAMASGCAKICQLASLTPKFAMEQLRALTDQMSTTARVPSILSSVQMDSA